MFKISYGQSPLLFLNATIFTYALGIYMTTYFSLSYKYLFLLIIVNLFFALFFTLRKYHFTFISYFSLFFFLGFLNSSFSLNLPQNNISHYDNQELQVIGKICTLPNIRQDNAGIYHLTYIIDSQKIIQDKNLIPTTGKIYLYQQVTDISFISPQIIGANIQCSGKLRLIQDYHNPGLINHELSAKEQGIYANLSIGKHDFKLLKLDTSFNFNRYLVYFHQYVLSSLQKIMSDNDAHMLFAMLFGGYNNIDKDLLDAYSTTGIIHILSVSGSHISLLSAFLLSLGKLFHLPRLFNIILLIIIIALYSILCGASAPILRASIMGILPIIALYLRRNATACHLLSITTLFLLLIDPLLLFNISFQLSFSATAGLVYLLPLLKNYLEKSTKLPIFIIDNLALTISAQVFSLPIVAWYFNSLSFSSLLANLIIIPPLEFIIIISLVATLIGCILPFTQEILFIVASLTLNLCNDLTLMLSHLPFAKVYLPTLNKLFTFSYYCSLFCFMNTSLRSNLSKLYFYIIKHLKHYVFLSIVMICLFGGFSYYIYQQHTSLQIHFIDVGQGDACLIITPKHHSILIDTGGSINSDFDIGSYVDLPYLRHYGIIKLDYLILSHLDKDHSGGAGSILQQIPVNHLIIANEGKDLYAKALHLAPDNPIMIKAIVAKQNMTFTIDNINFTFLQDNLTNSQSSNESSNVLKLTYHNFSALFTGDLPMVSESKLLAENAPLKSTILKVAHHGSKTSSSLEFLQAVQPQVAIISVGKYNRFGHPNQETLDKLSSLSTKILRTDKQGAIIIYTDGYKFHYQTYIN